MSDNKAIPTPDDTEDSDEYEESYEEQEESSDEPEEVEKPEEELNTEEPKKEPNPPSRPKKKKKSSQQGSQKTQDLQNQIDELQNLLSMYDQQTKLENTSMFRYHQLQLLQRTANALEALNDENGLYGLLRQTNQQLYEQNQVLREAYNLDDEYADEEE